MLIMWFINVSGAYHLLLVFAFTLVLGKGFWQVFIAIGLTSGWRGQVGAGPGMAFVNLEYIEAARALGFSNSRINCAAYMAQYMGPGYGNCCLQLASALSSKLG